MKRNDKMKKNGKKCLKNEKSGKIIKIRKRRKNETMQ